MKKYIISTMAWIVSAAPIYVLAICIDSLITEGLARNFAIIHILPCLWCIAGTWAIGINYLLKKPCRWVWIVFGALVVQAIGLELVILGPILF